MNIFEVVRALQDFRQSQSLFSVRISFVHRQARSQRSVMGVALFWESRGGSPSVREFCSFFSKLPVTQFIPVLIKMLLNVAYKLTVQKYDLTLCIIGLGGRCMVNDKISVLQVVYHKTLHPCAN